MSMFGAPGTPHRSATAKSGHLVLASALVLLGLGTSGCFGDPKNFHPGQGLGGTYGGQGGYGGPSGQGGYSGQGGAPLPPTCSATTTPGFTVRWSLEDSAGVPITCTAAGGATMDLDVLDVATSIASHDSFPCQAMTGASAVALTPGNYSVAMRLRNAGGDLLSEAIAPTTYPISAGCSTDLGLVPFEAAATTPDQYMTLSWTIDRVLTGVPLSCADARAAKVELDVGDTVFSWPCGDGKAATGSLAANTYSVVVKLLDATGTVLSVTPSMSFVVTAGQPKPLPTVTFDVN